MFHNFDRDSDGLSLVDAVLRSCSAPTYFPVYQNYCDGGVWANNPSMSAVAAAANQMVGNCRLDKQRVLSIGTGVNPMRLKTAKNDLGIIDWIKNGLIDVLVDGASMEAIDYYCRSTLGVHYHRVNMDLPSIIKLDDAAKVPKLIAIADEFDGTDTVSWLQGFWH